MHCRYMSTCNCTVYIYMDLTSQIIWYILISYIYIYIQYIHIVVTCLNAGYTLKYPRIPMYFHRPLKTQGALPHTRAATHLRQSLPSHHSTGVQRRVQRWVQPGGVDLLEHWLGGGNSNMSWNFHPERWGRWNHFDYIICFKWVGSTTR